MRCRRFWPDRPARALLQRPELSSLSPVRVGRERRFVCATDRLAHLLRRELGTLAFLVCSANRPPHVDRFDINAALVPGRWNPTISVPAERSPQMRIRTEEAAPPGHDQHVTGGAVRGDPPVWGTVPDARLPLLVVQPHAPARSEGSMERASRVRRPLHDRVRAEEHGTRSVLAGLICWLGAIAAHGLAGGGTAPVGIALMVAPVSVALCAVIIRRVGDIAAVGSAALLTQLCWHLLLMVTAPHSHEMAAPSVGTMFFAHVAVAGLTVAACLGAERALLELARDLVSCWLPPVAVHHVVRSRPIGVPTSGEPLRGPSWLVETAPGRGPPATSVRIS